MRCANESTSTRNDWQPPARVALLPQNKFYGEGYMSKISRRDLFKATLAAGLGISLPGGAQAHGGGRDDDDDDRGKDALVFVNGRIHTMDDRNSVVSSVAIKNGRFASVGNAEHG